jgi:hypothetical protein
MAAARRRGTAFPLVPCVRRPFRAGSHARRVRLRPCTGRSLVEAALARVQPGQPAARNVRRGEHDSLAASQSATGVLRDARSPRCPGRSRTPSLRRLELHARHWRRANRDGDRDLRAVGRGHLARGDGGGLSRLLAPPASVVPPRRNGALRLSHGRRRQSPAAARRKTRRLREHWQRPTPRTPSGGRHARWRFGAGARPR